MATRLSYFEMRGRAEPARLMLHATDTPFDDHRIVTATEWEEARTRLPFGALPLYESGGESLCQSHEIFRALARAAGWLGRSEHEDRELGVTQEALAEAQEDLWRFAWVDDYPSKAARYAKETLHPRLEALSRWFGRRAGDARFWVGDAPTHVDFIGFCFLDEVDAFFPGVLAAFPKLVEARAEVARIAGVQAYLESGRRPAVFGMGGRGPKVDPRMRPEPDAMFETPWFEPIPLKASSPWV